MTGPHAVADLEQLAQQLARAGRLAGTVPDLPPDLERALVSLGSAVSRFEVALAQFALSAPLSSPDHDR